MTTSKNRVIPRLVAASAAGALACVGLAAPSTAVAADQAVSSSWLTGYFNNVAIGDPGSTSADFDFLAPPDAAGPSYLIRSDAGVAGGTPMTTDDGLSFSIGGEIPDEPDNVSAEGQTIDTHLALGSGASTPATKIAIVGAGTSGQQTKDLVLQFSDNSEQTLSDVTLSDWCDSSPHGDNTLVGTWPQRWYDGSVQSLPCGLWSTKTFELAPDTPGATLTSITLPDDEDFHVFAIASNAVTDDASLTVTGALDSGAAIDASATTYDGTPVTVTMSGSASWTPSSATTSYAWLVDGTPLAGEHSDTITLPATAMGKPVVGVITGTAEGYIPGQVEVGSVTIEPGTITVTHDPSISGGPARVGDQLTASGATFDSGPVTADLDYQWLADGEKIAGATSDSFRPAGPQLGKKISVDVTASADGFDPITVTSEETDPVESGSFTQTSPATITGSYAAGETLQAAPGSYDVPSVHVSFQWTADTVDIDGATSSTLTLTPDLVGKTIGLTASATKSGYDDVVTSVDGEKVVAGTLTVSQPAIITGDAVVGSTLTLQPGAYLPSTAEESYQWMADGEPISGETSFSYRPAASNVNAKIQVRLTVTAPGFQDYVTTIDAGAVAPGQIQVLSGPAVKGKAKVGKKLKAKPGSYSPASVDVSYQWVVNGTPVKGKKGTKKHYKLKGKDAKKKVRLEVTVSESGYATLTTTSSETKVKKGKIKVKKKAKIKKRHKKNKVRVGKKLKVTKGKYKPKNVKIKYRWFAGKDKIKGKKGKKKHYKIRKADKGSKLRVKVKVKKKGYKKTTYKTTKTVKVKKKK